MQTIILFHNSKWYISFWILLFSLSLMLLRYRRKYWKEGYDSFFWLIICSIIVLYCPLLADILIPRFLPSYAEYERISWIFFMTPLISYVFISLANDLSKTIYRYLFVASFLAVLLLMGSPDNRNFFQTPENQYKISKEAIDICNKLDSLSPENSLTLCMQLDSEKSFDSGNDLGGVVYYGIRSFESRFSIIHKLISPEQYKQNGFKLTVDLPNYIDYYISPKADNIYKELERLGYTYVDESENFAIFQNLNKQESDEGS